MTDNLLATTDEQYTIAGCPVRIIQRPWNLLGKDEICTTWSVTKFGVVVTVRTDLRPFAHRKRALDVARDQAEACAMAVSVIVRHAQAIDR